LSKILVQAVVPGGMYTADTMSSAFEALGMSLPYSSTMSNIDEEKDKVRLNQLVFLLKQ
jgi:dihydroxy-acid dehydratase